MSRSKRLDGTLTRPDGLGPPNGGPLTPGAQLIRPRVGFFLLADVLPNDPLVHVRAELTIPSAAPGSTGTEGRRHRGLRANNFVRNAVSTAVGPMESRSMFQRFTLASEATPTWPDGTFAGRPCFSFAKARRTALDLRRC